MHPPAGGEKVVWHGVVTSVQSRIRLTRSFDEFWHSYLGYVLRVERTRGDERGSFSVAVGKAAHERHRFRVGMVVRGRSVPVADPRKETATLYRTSGIEVIERPPEETPPGPPFLGVPPPLPTYRERGHRRLDARTYAAKCIPCIWGCRMAVEIIIDPWHPTEKRYRFETFCYGP